MEHITNTKEEEILEQVKTDFDFWSQGDTEGYGKSADDNVTFFNDMAPGERVDGIQAFRELLKSLKGQIPIHNYELVDPKVQIYGDVGIFTVHYHVFSPDGKFLFKPRGTCVYRKAGNSWKMVHAHWSIIEEA